MKKIMVIAVLLSTFSAFSNSGECYWACNNGEWVPIKNGVCIMPPKPVNLCPF